MQDRYVGDIGDFARCGLLRVLSEGRRLGVAWYLYPNEGHNNDGGFVSYLDRPQIWRPLDAELFDGLNALVRDNRRCVVALQESGLLPGARFAGELLDANAVPVQQRAKWRAGWFERVLEQLEGCDIVYADPDNGLCLDERFQPTRAKSWKRLPLREARALSDGRVAILYHHNSHFPGGHRAEIRHWMAQLPGCTHAFYCRRYTNRTYFVVNPDTQMVARLAEFAEAWQQAELRLGLNPSQYSQLITREELQR